jgi:hypothetical protein
MITEYMARSLNSACALIRFSTTPTMRVGWASGPVPKYMVLPTALAPGHSFSASGLVMITPGGYTFSVASLTSTSSGARKSRPSTTVRPKVLTSESPDT